MNVGHFGVQSSGRLQQTAVNPLVTLSGAKPAGPGRAVGVAAPTGLS